VRSQAFEEKKTRFDFFCKNSHLTLRRRRRRIRTRNLQIIGEKKDIDNLERKEKVKKSLSYFSFFQF
jgi:hypothetical protein